MSFVSLRLRAMFRRRCNTKVVLMLIIGCFIYSAYLYISGPGDGSLWDDVVLDTNAQNIDIKSGNAVKKYLINTTGCLMEQIDPLDERYPQMNEYFKLRYQEVCSNDGSILTSLSDGVLRVNDDIKQKSYPSLHSCTYRSFGPNFQDVNSALEGQESVLDIKNGATIAHDFIRVECKDSNNQPIYNNIHKQIVQDTVFASEPKHIRGSDDLNVMLIVLESVGKLAFLRHCPQLHEYLTKDLGGALLEGHTKIGLNTNPNLYGMLSGRVLSEDWKSLLFSSIEDVDWVFKNFKNKGYTTLLSEDTGKVPAILKYFTKPPTNHWDRPALLHVEQKPFVGHAQYTGHQDYCYGPQQKVEMTLDWMLDFFRKYKNNKLFSMTYFMHILGTHKDLNGISRNCPMMTSFFKAAQREGLLDNTAIILTGDHGNGFIEDYFKSQIGSYEARQPATFVIMPKWFHVQHSASYKNLLLNGKSRLTSHYDIYKTFLSIVNKEYEPTPRDGKAGHGISLFNEIPGSRSCKEAGVPNHYCLCGTFLPLPTNDKKVLLAAKFMVNSVNQLLTDAQDLCVNYEKVHVETATLHYPSEGMTLIVQFTPYKANFRGYVEVVDNKMRLTDIERLDNYRDLVKCLNALSEKVIWKNEQMASLCFCKDLK